jgi:ankyrin repeat protein
VAAPPPAAAVAAKPGTTTQEAVVVTGSRIQRRDFNASSPVVTSLPAPAVISDPLVKVLDGDSRLREAASAGRTADIEALLAEGVPADTPDDQGETALMKSIEAGQRDAAALLRRHGASLDVKNRAGVSARDMAAKKDDAELDQALGLTR